MIADLDSVSMSNNKLSVSGVGERRGIATRGVPSAGREMGGDKVAAFGRKGCGKKEKSRNNFKDPSSKRYGWE